MRSTTRHCLTAAAVVVAAVLLSPSPARGQVVLLADIKTVTSRGPTLNDSPLQRRLFLDSAGTQLAPLGTPLWFVADLAGDGLLAERLGRSGIGPSEMLGPDDVLLDRDIIDGDQPGSFDGAFRRNGKSMEVPLGRTLDAILAGSIYVILWNDPAVEKVPLEGASFGLLDLGVVVKPAIGNPFWAIDQNIMATAFTIMPVPELESALGAGLLLVAWAGYRRFRAAGTVHVGTRLP